MLAKVYLKCSTMAAGKTALACMTAYQYEEQGVKVLCCKPSLSPYVYGKFKSRVKQLERQCFNISRDMDLSWIRHQDCNIVIVDECQFLTQLQVEQIFRLSLKHGITFICYGLITDFQTNLFEGSKRFIELGAIIEQIKHIGPNNERTVINAKVDNSGNILLTGEVIDKKKEQYVSMTLREYWTKLGVI